jgi:ribonuclease HI
VSQVVADFIIDHMVIVDDEACLVEICSWKLLFDGSVCSKGPGVSCVVISPSGAIFDLAIRLEFACTNNQAKYEALLYGLEYLSDMGVKDVEAFSDSRLVVQHIKGGKRVPRWSFK